MQWFKKLVNRIKQKPKEVVEEYKSSTSSPTSTKTKVDKRLVQFAEAKSKFISTRDILVLSEDIVDLLSIEDQIWCSENAARIILFQNCTLINTSIVRA